MRRRLLWLLGALLLLALLLAGWLLGSASGLGFLLARVQAGWPGLALQVEGVRGRLLGPLELDVVSLQAGERPLRLQGVQLDWSPLALLGGELVLQQVAVGRIEVGGASVPAAPPAPFDPAALRWQWPQHDLPLALSVAALSLGPVQVEQQVVLEQAAVALRIERDGRLQITRLQLRHAEGELQLHGTLPGAAPGNGLQGSLRRGDSALAVALDAGPDGAALELAVVGQAARARFSVRPPFAWQLAVDAEQADLRGISEALPPALTLAISGQGDGAGGTLQLQHDGTLAPLRRLQASLAWQQAPPTLLIKDLRIEPVGGGMLQGQGALALQDAPALDASLRAEAAAWQQDAPAAPAPRLDGEFRLQGPLDTLRIEGSGSLRRGGQTLPLQLAGQRDASGFALERLRLDGAAGLLDVAGRVDWAPRLMLALGLQLGRFDPAWLDARLSGQLSGTGSLQVQDVDGDLLATLGLDSLAGEWRGAPLRATGQLRWQADRLGGALDVQLGAGRVQLAAAADGEMQVAIDALSLQAVWPGLAGAVQGRVQLRQPLSPLHLTVDLRGSDLRQDDLRIDHLRLHGGLAAGDSRLLLLTADGVHLGEGAAPIALRLGVQGDTTEQVVSLDGKAEGWHLQAAARASASAGQRTLDIDSLAVSHEGAGNWSLVESAPIVLAPELSVPRHCLADQASRACVALAGGGTRELAWTIERLPLARLLALSGASSSLRVGGELSLDGRIELAPRLRPLTLEGVLAAGELVETDAETPISLLAWADSRVEARHDGGQLEGALHLQLADEGEVTGTFTLPWDATPQLAQLDARLRVDIRQLRALGVLAPDVQQAQGALRGELRWLAGAPDNPQGEIGLHGFSATLPALGIRVIEGDVALRQQDGRLQLDGFLATGEGPLRLEGVVEGPDRAQLRLAGERVRLADTPRLQLLASPDLDLRWQQGRLRVRGTVGVPSAHLDLERIEAGITTSPDVVVLDPARPPSGIAALPLDADIQIRLGDAVTLAGFGFDGGIAGDLRVIERRGQPARGRGSLDLRGTYRAYGQDLAIERGRLLFASSALDNPGIDLRAKRALREVEVGVEVRGSARRPRLGVWSNPALDQAEALSWLVLGRPLRAASAADGDQLGQAAAAVGGNLLAAQVGGRLGFDTFGIADSTALGGAAFTVGKYLSPRLYLSYGVALFDSGRVVTLRYLINERLDVEIEAAAESRAGVNYRIERD